MKKKSIGFICLVLASFLITWLFGYQLVIPLSKYKKYIHYQVDVNDTLKLLDQFDFSKSEYKIYLNLSFDDFNNSKCKFARTMCMKIDDPKVLDKFKDKWVVLNTGSDMTTVSSTINFFKGRKLIFSAGIVPCDGEAGIQMQELGWLKFVNHENIEEGFSYFKPIYYPIVFL